MDAQAIVVYVTVRSTDQAEKIASALVEEKLAACINRIGPIQSTYQWKGDLCHAEEFLLMIKTRRECLEPLTQRVQELHSYDMPEVIALPIVGGTKAYMNWILEETTP